MNGRSKETRGERTEVKGGRTKGRLKEVEAGEWKKLERQPAG